jgi:hypothetical protein
VQNSEWLTQYLEKVANTCDEGRFAVEYIRAKKTMVGFKRAHKSVGAFWTLPGNIHLNSIYHTHESTLTNPRAWTILIHEVRHLQQGWLTALSVYGELDAWQYEFSVYKKIINKKLVPAVEELLSLPLNWDRNNLLRARTLMQSHAGKGYRLDLLSLYPLDKEIKYWLTRRKFV